VFGGHGGEEVGGGWVPEFLWPAAPVQEEAVAEAAEISKGIRAGSMFMLPLYVCILCFVGSFGGEIEWYGSAGRLALMGAAAVSTARALFQLLELPFRRTCSHSIFRIAVVNAKGERAGIATPLRAASQPRSA